MKDVKVRADLKGLNALLKGIEGMNGLVVKVGVLSPKNSRSDSVGETNASIGAIHEFGSYTRNIPERSFLKMPLTRKASELVKTASALAQDAMLKNDPVALLTRIGIAAEGIVGDAFKTSGWGSWKPLKAVTIARKGSLKILIETSQLQRSIMSQVVRKGV